MNRNTLSVIQSSLRISRQNLIQDFLDESPDIFLPSYKYEKSKQLLNISIEKYFVSWLGDHWNVFQRLISVDSKSESQNKIEVEFSRVLVDLMSKWSFGMSNKDTSINLALSVIEDMKLSLNNFQKIGDKADLSQNKLTTFLEKNRVIFDRTIKRMEAEL